MGLKACNCGYLSSFAVYQMRSKGFEGQKALAMQDFAVFCSKKAIKSRRWWRRAVFCRFTFKYTLNNAQSLQNRLFGCICPAFILFCAVFVFFRCFLRGFAWRLAWICAASGAVFHDFYTLLRISALLSGKDPSFSCPGSFFPIFVI